MHDVDLKEKMCGQISLSLMCNIRHSFCFQTCFSTDRLSDDILYNKLAPFYNQVNSMRLLGGEPTVIPGIKRYILWLKENYPNINLEIVTNGIALDGEWLEIIKTCNLAVQVSVNGISDRVFMKIMTVGDPIKLKNNIFGNLGRLIKLHHENGDSVINCISMVINEDTFEDIEEFAKYGLKNRINITYQLPSELARYCIDDSIYKMAQKAVLIKFYCENYINVTLQGLSDQLYNQIALECITKEEISNKESFLKPLSIETSNNHKKKIGAYMFCDEDKRENNCIMPTYGYSIMSDGWVYPCCYLSNYPIGNLYLDDIEQIFWNNERRTNLQKNINEGNYQYCWKRCMYNRNPNSSVDGVALPYLLTSKIKFDSGNYAEALKCIERMEGTPLYTPEVCYEHAFCLHMIQEKEHALKKYNDALKAGFDEFWVKYNRGALLLDLKQIDEAKEDIIRAYKLKPEHEGVQLLYNNLDAN